MRRLKKHPKLYVVSIRVSGEEKSALEEMTRCGSMSISNLVREALQNYVPNLQGGATRS